jgi:hypothetical protein
MMRCWSAVYVCAMLLVAACSTSQPYKSPAAEPGLYGTAARPVKTMAATLDLVKRLREVCIEPLLGNAFSNVPMVAGGADAARQCARDRLASAVAEPLGRMVCDREADLGKYAVCLMQGAYQNRLRAGMGSPSQLSEEEWRNSDFAISNTVSELVAKSFSQCVTGDRAAIEQCQLQVSLSSYGLSEADTAACLLRQDTAAYCIADKSVAGFIETVTLLVW